jgi:HAD superfamily hydrolase (TIGR01509 family)
VVHSPKKISWPVAVLFDMDGTLTEPLLDFSQIKAEMGIGDQPILEALATMTPAGRNRAEAILHRYEDEAARRSTLNPGCHEVLDLLKAKGVRVALITRNSRSSVRTVMDVHRLSIDVLVTREDAPPKPDPEPLFQACRRLEVDPAAAWMIGDGEFDVRAGLNAGVRTVWLSHRRPKHFPDTPWREVNDLWELIRLLEACDQT